MLVVFLYIEIDRTVDFVSKALVDELLNDLDLLDDVTCRRGLDARREDVELTHDAMEVFGVAFHHFHRFQLLQSCFLGNFVFALVGVVFEVTHVGDVSDVPDPVSQESEVARNDVEGEERTNIPQVHIIIYCGSADVHADPTGHLGRQLFLGSGQRVG